MEPTAAVKYEYFKELAFLTPYIKFRSISFESSDGKTIVSKREVDKDQSEEVKLFEQDGYFAEEQEQQEQTYLQESAGLQNIIYESTTVDHVPEFSGTSHELAVQQSDEENLNAVKRKRRSDNWHDVEEQDDNKYFAMSVACTLKRLSTINNLKAKREILEVLERITSHQHDRQATSNPPTLSLEAS